MKKIKDIILNEGFRSVVANGIRSFTVESLASGLSMSKKTIYQYFPKKEILIKKIIDFRMKKLTNEFNKIISQESDSIIQFVKIREHNIRLANNLNLQKLTYLKARYPDIWEIIEKYRLTGLDKFHIITKSLAGSGSNLITSIFRLGPKIST